MNRMVLLSVVIVILLKLALLFLSNVKHLKNSRIMQLKPQFISLIVCQFLRNKSPFECLFHQTFDYVFLRIFRCLCFSLLLPYNAHKLDYRSTSYVFLGYSSSQLGYRCLDLSYNRIYISRHVGFHEHVFPFNEFAHSPHISPSVPPLYLLLSPAYPSSPSFQHKLSQPHHPSQITRRSPHHHLHLSLLIIFTSSSYAVPTLSLSNSPFVVVSPASPPGSPYPFGNSASSLLGLNLYVDLFTYSLPQQNSTNQSPVPPLTWHHLMVLRPRQQKTVNISSGFVSSLLASAPQITSPSTLEPLNFKEADQYLCWHTAIKSEIVALYANATWSLVLFDPSMNIVGCWWVYKIKHQANGAINRYKACLVVWGFT